MVSDLGKVVILPSNLLLRSVKVWLGGLKQMLPNALIPFHTIACLTFFPRRSVAGRLWP
jgi:hypothetical protein